MKLGVLNSCIGCGCLSLKRCAISNPGDSAAVVAAVAVYLPKALRQQQFGRPTATP
jgi:MerR family transcriptional regulator, redox-sensitive transcriptional activator SoxR